MEPKNDIFTVVLNEKGTYSIVTGKMLMTREEFATAEEAEDYVKQKPYELFWNMIAVYRMIEEEYIKNGKEVKNEIQGITDTDS